MKSSEVRKAVDWSEYVFRILCSKKCPNILESGRSDMLENDCGPQKLHFWPSAHDQILTDEKRHVRHV